MSRLIQELEKLCDLVIVFSCITIPLYLSSSDTSGHTFFVKHPTFLARFVCESGVWLPSRGKLEIIHALLVKTVCRWHFFTPLKLATHNFSVFLLNSFKGLKMIDDHELQIFQTFPGLCRNPEGTKEKVFSCLLEYYTVGRLFTVDFPFNQACFTVEIKIVVCFYSF